MWCVGIAVGLAMLGIGGMVGLAQARQEPQRPVRVHAPPKYRGSRLGVGFAATGTTFQPVVFENTGSATCSLTGYPIVSLMNGGSPQYAVAPVRSLSNRVTPDYLKKIVLKKHGLVSFLIVGNDMPHPDSPCLGWSSFEVVAPGLPKGADFHQSIGSCESLGETMLAPGSTGGMPVEQ